MNHTTFLNGSIETTELMKQLVSMRNREGSQPLFCIHPSGGDIGIFRKLATRLGPSRAIWGIQSRLECGAKTEYPSLVEMASAYARIIEIQNPNGPVRLLGFSLGGFLASLIAKELHDHGRVVSFLGLIDSNPGWTGASENSRHELCVRLAQVFTKFQSIGVMRQKPLEEVHRDVAILVEACLDEDPVPASEIMARTTAMGYVSDRETDGNVLMKFTSTFITHCRLLKGFEPPEVNCPLHLWWPSDGKQENDVGSEIWAGQAKSTFAESVIEGSHYSIMRGSAVRTLAAEIHEAIEESEPELAKSSWQPKRPK